MHVPRTDPPALFKINSLDMKKNWMYIALVAVVLSGLHSLWGQTPVVLGDYVFTAAEDDGSNYTLSTFVEGQNLGYGFSNWYSEKIGSTGESLSSTNGYFFLRADFFQGDEFGGIPDVDAIYRIGRSFESLMKPGDRFMVDLRYGSDSFDDLSEIYIKLNSDTVPKIELVFIRQSASGANQVWDIYEDGVFNHSTNEILSVLSIFKYEVVYNGNNMYSYKIGNSAFIDRTATSNISAIDGFEIMVKNLSSNRTLAFNNMKIESKHTVGLSTDGSSSDFVLDTATTPNQTVTAPLFEIRDGSSLTVPSNGSLQIDGELQNDGALLLESASNNFSSLQFGDEATIAVSATGTVTYNRHINGFPANDLLASPVGDLSFGALLGDNENVLLSGSIDGTPGYHLFGAYEVANNTFGSFNATSDASNSITSGVGYRAGANGSNALAFSNAMSNLQTADLSRPLVFSTNSRNWNLVGNPYPTYLDMLSLLTANATTGVLHEDSVALYAYGGTDSNGMLWDTVTLADLETTNQYMAPGQGFFVRASATAGNFNFTTAMQTHTGSDDFISGRAAQEADQFRFKLRLENGQSHFNTRFFFLDNGTDGLDVGYDASLWRSLPPSFGVYSQLLEDTTGVPMAVQTLHPNRLADGIIPLGVEAAAGMQLRFGLDALVLPDNVSVVLHDMEAQTYTNLRQSDYVVSLNNAASGIGRFYINLEQKTLSNSAQAYSALKVYAAQQTNQLVVTGVLQDAVQLDMFDIAGRHIMAVALQPGMPKQYVPLAKLATGAFVVRLKGSAGERSFKVLIQ